MTRLSSTLRNVSFAAGDPWIRLAFFAVVALAFTWPLLGVAGMMNFFRDAQVLLPYEEIARRSVLEFGQAPLWDPYYCGGLYELGTPQSRFASPTFLLTLLLGARRAEPAIVFAMVLLGLEGTYRYARARGAAALGAILAAPIFAASGVFATAPHLGWLSFLGFELLPWAALGMRLALRGRRSGVAVAALALAWITGFGGTYAAPMAGLLLAFELGEALATRRAHQPTRTGMLSAAALVALFAAGLAAVRLWPLLETIVAAPRVLTDRPGLSVPSILKALVLPVMTKDGNVEPYFQMFTVGLLGLAVGLAAVWRRRAWPVLALGLLAAWTAAGYAGPWSPFRLLRALPVYSSLRYPERYLIIVALATSAAAALAVDGLALLARRRPRWNAVRAAALAALVLNTVVLLRNPIRIGRDRWLGPPPVKISREFHQARGNRWLAALYAPMDRGSLSCWEAYPVPQSEALRADLDQEEYLADRAAGLVTRRLWSPNRIELDVSLSRPTRLLVNQNHHPGWRSSSGPVVSHQGLLAVDLPAGESRVVLRFLPTSALGGGALSLVSLIALFLFVRASTGRRTTSTPRRAPCPPGWPER